MVAETRTGIAGQFGFGRESEVALATRATPDNFIPFVSVTGADDTTVLRAETMSGGVLPSIDDRVEIFHGVSRVLTFPWRTKGFPGLLQLCLGGYSIAWPGSTNGSGTLTFGGAVPVADDTVVIGSQTYTFKATVGTTANEVLIGSDVATCAVNLEAAINRGYASTGEGPGDIYGSLTPINTEVTAAASTNTVVVTDKQARGAAVNSGGASEVATTETLTDASNIWGAATLASGANGTDTERVHTFTLDWAKLRELAMTGQVVMTPSEAARTAFTYGGGKVTSTSISVAVGQLLQIVPTVHFRNRDLSTAIAAASYASGAKLYDQTQVGVTIDAASTPVTGFNLTIPMEVATDRLELGSGVPLNQIGATAKPIITGELPREFKNTDLYADWIAGGSGKIIATATGATIPSSSNPYKVVITIEDCVWTGSTPDQTGPGIQQQNVPFEINDDGSNEPLTIAVHTDELWAA